MRERDTAALNERCNAQLELSAVVRLWFSENESSTAVAYVGGAPNRRQQNCRRTLQQVIITKCAIFRGMFASVCDT